MLLLLFLSILAQTFAQEKPPYRLKIIVEEFAYASPHTKYLITPDSINVYRQSLSGEESFHKALTKEERQLFFDLLNKVDIKKFKEEYTGVSKEEEDGLIKLSWHDWQYVLRILSGQEFQKIRIYGYQLPFFYELVQHIHSLVPVQFMLHYNEKYLRRYNNNSSKR
jgi:hypothetical protein